MSLVLAPAYELEQSLITSFAGMCACEAICEVCGIQAGIKWVNDLYVDGRKLAGILVELVQEKGVQFLVVGIGINGLVAPVLNGGVATTCLLDHCKKPDLELVCATIAKRLIIGLCNGFDPNQTIDYCRRHSILLGHTVSFDYHGKRMAVNAVDIDDAGQLVVDVGGRLLSLTSVACDVRIVE